MLPLAFSWTAARLAAVDSNSRGKVVDVASGEVIWSDSTAEQTQAAISNPHGSELMTVATTGRLTDLFVISATGVGHRIASDVFLAQALPCVDCSAA